MLPISKQLKKWSELYYAGTPEISNEEYDAVERIHGQILSGLGDIPHAFRMYSLKKHYDKDGTPPLTGDLVKTVKLDGAAVALTYVGGELVRALTRGDGIKGMDITSNISQMSSVPTKLKTDHPLVQVTGEVVAVSSVENSRNYASGALKQLKTDAFIQRRDAGKMVFVAYNLQHKPDHWGACDTYTQDLALMKDLGFSVITEDFSDYPTDGTVFRVNSNSKFSSLGFTDKFPRGAYAHKEEQESVVTTLLGVEWNTGKSGKVTPTAILDPTVIGEALISRATLNNIEYIEALNLEIGCKVKVIRAGEIIPSIIGRLD